MGFRVLFQQTNKQTNYRESSYITLTDLYKEYIDYTTNLKTLLIDLLFIQLIVEMKYQPDDMYKEFAENVIRNSQNTILNFEIMHDYTTAISR